MCFPSAPPPPPIVTQAPPPALPLPVSKAPVSTLAARKKKRQHVEELEIPVADELASEPSNQIQDKLY